MAVDAGELLLGVRADLAGLQSQLTAAMGPIGSAASAQLSSSLAAGLKKAGAGLTSAGRTMTRSITLPLVGIGVVATKLALDYDKAFTQIAATTNFGQKQIDAWRESVLKLSGETARSPEELANALYFLASAGLDAAQVGEALESSAKASAAGLGDTADIARITANALNAYSEEGLTAAEVTDTLVAAVREGTADPEEFSGALGRILPIASKAGVGFDQVAASLATVSNIGLDVNEGVTAMRGLLQALVAPTQQTQDALKDLGLSADDVRSSLSEDGLLDTLDLLDEKSHGQIETIQQLVPNVRSLTGFFGLQGQEAEKVDKIFEHLADSTGSLNKAFETTKESNAFKFQKGLNDLRVAGIKLGNQLIPILVDDIIPAVQDALKWWGKLSPESKELALKLAGLAILAGPLLRLAGAFTSLAGGLAKFVPWVLRLGSASGGAGLAGLGAAAAGAAGAGRVPLLPPGVGPGGLPAPPPPVGPALPTMGGFGTTSGLGATGLGAKVIPFTPFNPVEYLDGIDTASEILAGFDEQQLSAKDAAVNLTKALADQGIQYQVSAEAIRVSREQGISYADAVEQIGLGVEDLKDGIGPLARSLDSDLGAAIRNVSGGTKKEKEELAGLVRAFRNMDVPIGKSTKSMVENLLAAGDEAAAYKLLKERFERATKPLKNLHTQQEAVKESSADMAQRQRGAAGAIENTGNKAKDSQGEVDGYKSALDGIPKSKSTKITTPGLAEATSGVQGLASGLNGLKSTYVINVQLNREGWPGRASGGPIVPNRPYIVGEHGPELFSSPTSGRITPTEHMGAHRGEEGTARMVVLEGAVDIDSGRIRVLAREEIDGENRYRGTRARAIR